ncbi:MAG: LysM peptidoglycan-binding domain-containing M23 family metallopeptidase [Spirochaetota bacterium]
MLTPWLILLFLLATFVFTSVAYASPFDSFERELKDYIKSDTYQYHDDSVQSQIDKLFSQEISGKDSRGGGYFRNTYTRKIKLPSRLPVKRVVSTKVIRPKKRVYSYYKVKRRDTLSKIARKYRTSVAKLKRQNGIRSYIIRTGQVLRIPRYRRSVGRRIVRYKLFARPVKGRITSRFGYRRDPFRSKRRNFHSGIDFSASVGTPVIAASDGVVIFTGRSGGYGNTIKIRHKGGYVTRYAHCSTTVVKVGQKVRMGKVIGSVGRTGTATGAHLHFEVMYKGRHINPLSALRKTRTVVTKYRSSSSSKKRS